MHYQFETAVGVKWRSCFGKKKLWLDIVFHEKNINACIVTYTYSACVLYLVGASWGKCFDVTNKELLAVCSCFWKVGINDCFPNQWVIYIYWILKDESWWAKLLFCWDLDNESIFLSNQSVISAGMKFLSYIYRFSNKLLCFSVKRNKLKFVCHGCPSGTFCYFNVRMNIYK